MSARGCSGRCRAPMGPRRRPAGCCRSSALRARSGPAPASRCGCRPPRRRGCWCRPRHWSMRKRAPTSIAVTARVAPPAFTMRRCRCGRCRGQVEAPGLDATQVESLVTRPLEDVLGGAENVEAVRSTSSQGLAAIQVVFGRGSDPYLQRQVISERLGGGSALLPPGIGPPQLSPLSSSMEYLLHFGFTSDRLSPLELHDLVRWTLKPQILAVPGVAQAQIFGGESRERQLWVDPVKLNP